MKEPTDDNTNDSTDDEPALPIDFAATWSYDTIGIGEVTDDLNDYADYEHAIVDAGRLRELLDVVDTFGWSEVHLALCDEQPVILQNAQADDKPTLALCPRIYDLDDD